MANQMILVGVYSESVDALSAAEISESDEWKVKVFVFGGPSLGPLYFFQLSISALKSWETTMTHLLSDKLREYNIIPFEPNVDFGEYLPGTLEALRQIVHTRYQQVSPDAVASLKLTAQEFRYIKSIEIQRRRMLRA